MTQPSDRHIATSAASASPLQSARLLPSLLRWYRTRRDLIRSVRADARLLTQLGRSHDVTAQEWRRLP